VYEDLEQIAQLWQQDRRFDPAMDEDRRQQLYQGWLRALARVKS
jgi:glycerol kinase